MNQNTTINCRNCAYYLQHYIKDVKGKFIKVIDCGHCSNVHILRHTNPNKPCAFWQPLELQAIERKKNVKATLENIETLLQKISIALESDDT